MHFNDTSGFDTSTKNVLFRGLIVLRTQTIQILQETDEGTGGESLASIKYNVQ